MMIAMVMNRNATNAATAAKKVEFVLLVMVVSGLVAVEEKEVVSSDKMLLVTEELVIVETVFKVEKLSEDEVNGVDNWLVRCIVLSKFVLSTGIPSSVGATEEARTISISVLISEENCELVDRVTMVSFVPELISEGACAAVSEASTVPE